MDRTYRFRTSLVVALILVVAAVFTIRLFGLQLTEDETDTYSSADTVTYTVNVSAARGEILDRHGTVLVRNRATYNVIINSFPLYNSEDPNGSLLALAETCRKNNIEYQDSLPLSMTSPYTYTLDQLSSGQTYTYKRFLLNRGWDADMTAENLYKKLRQVYRISDEYTDYEARLIMGLRYGLDLPTYAYTDTYTLSEDVSADQLAILKELAIPGMEVTTTTVREYNTSFAAQLLGYVRAMDPDQYENIYKDKGYAMDAKVGQEGLEAAFEEYLHGTDGVKVVTVAADGTVLDEYWEVEPQSGANVVTTIDIGLQEVAEKSLATHIQALAEEKKAAGNMDGYDANAGAAVVMDVRNGEVLTVANYPTYDITDYDYSALLQEEPSPLTNRAMDYAFPPGSTFKPLTAIAAMRAGIPDTTTVDGTGYYTFSDGTTLNCWIWTQSHITHGTLDMRGALAQSCNIYFYTVGMMAAQIGDIQLLINTAESFGIGQDPGSEVPMATFGRMASPEVKKEVYADVVSDADETRWYEADTATASIGQSLTQVTPLQLCRYVTALANKGTLYKATFLRRAVSSDFQYPVKENDYTPVATDLLTQNEWQVIYDGMRLCVTEGTGKKLASYPIAVCAKTGTASHGTGGSDHGAFVCWAPADNPEIAIAIYVEHGASGSNFAGVAEDILDYYFNFQDQVQEIELENEMTED